MNNFHKIILLAYLLVFSCKKTSKDVIIQQEHHIEDLTNKNSNIEKNTSIILNEIINKKLIPLKLINKEEKEVYKKYQIDFYATCMCDSQSMNINTKDNVLTVFDYCYGDMPNNEEIANKYLIKKT